MFASIHLGCTNPDTTDGELETALDAEWASAAAPLAQIYLVSCANEGPAAGVFTALQHLLNGDYNAVGIVSISYGWCEVQNGLAANAAVASLYQTAVMGGTSIFVAAGDGGAAGCDDKARIALQGINVDGWASTPYNVAVGGTDFADTYNGTNSTYWNATNGQYYGSAKSYIPEIPWNGTCAGELITAYEKFAVPYGPQSFCASANGQQLLHVWGGGGGASSCAVQNNGICAGWPRPSWQVGVAGNPSDHVRDIPDVSLHAAFGPWGHSYALCMSDSHHDGGPCFANGVPSAGSGGTSFAAPIMAGVQALIDQYVNSLGEGNPNYRLYELASQQYGASGTNACESSNPAAPSNPNCIFYDIITGDNVVACATGTPNCFGPVSAIGTGVGALSRSVSSFQPAYTAGPGWDFATGLGSIDVAKLVHNWNPPTTPAPPNAAQFPYRAFCVP